MTNIKFPNSPEAEQQLLGAVLLDNGLLSEAAQLDDDAFYNARHRRAFQAMKNLADLKEPITPLTVANYVGNKTDLSVTEVSSWTHGLPFEMVIDTQIAILRDKQLKRKIIRDADAVKQNAMSESDTGSNLAGQAAEIFQETLSGSLVKRRPTLRIDEALEESYETWDRVVSGHVVSVGTGIPDIDTNLTGGGFAKGMFHVIGARPGKGKTTFALDMAWYNVVAGNVVVFFTLELSRTVFMDRLVAPLSGIKRYMLDWPWINEATVKTLHAVGGQMQQFPFYVNDRARSLSDMRIELNNVARRTGGKIDVIIVDFLTKMENSHSKEYDSVSRNANGLAQFAADYGAAVICLSQLTRKNEEGEIALAHFRGSGQIEELGRTILGLWGDDDTKGMCDVTCTCLKQGEGRTFDATLTFDKEYMTFGVRQCLLDPATKN